ARIACREGKGGVRVVGVAVGAGIDLNAPALVGADLAARAARGPALVLVADRRVLAGPRVPRPDRRARALKRDRVGGAAVVGEGAEAGVRDPDLVAVLAVDEVGAAVRVPDQVVA